MTATAKVRIEPIDSLIRELYRPGRTTVDGFVDAKICRIRADGHQIGDLVNYGKGKRSSLITEILDHEIRRRRLMQILDDAAACWKDEDHPELKDGAYAWVRQMRDEDDRHSREKLGDWLSPRE